MELFFRHYGKGRPIVILHGIFGISDNWVSVARALAEKYEIFILDQRNHGHSPHHPVHTYEAMCADLEEFINRHQITRPVLLGHSMGGKVAMRYALEHPDIPRGLIIVDISLRTYDRRYTHLNLIDAMMSINLEKVSSREEVARQLQPLIPDERLLMFVLKNLYRRERGHLAWRLNLEAINMYIDEIFKGIQSDKLYRGPALFLRGGKSDYVKYEDFDQIYRNFPRADIYTIEEAGHWLHADAPEEFLQVVRSFLERIDGEES